MPEQILIEPGRRGIFNPFLKHDHIDVVGIVNVNLDKAGDSRAVVLEPFNEIPVLQRRHTVQMLIGTDQRVGRIDLIL